MSPRREFWDIARKTYADVKEFGAKVWPILNWLRIGLVFGFLKTLIYIWIT
jgi:hypothetical protein